MTRFLLPFTFGIDADAIEHALMLAKRAHAVLVVASLLCVAKADGTARKIRLGDIEQSKDFLVLVQCKAARYNVPLERVELYSQNTVRSIQMLSTEMDCDAILAFMRDDKGILLSSSEVAQLLCDEYISLLAVRLKMRKPSWIVIKDLLTYWLHRKDISQLEPVIVQPRNLRKSS